MRVSLAILTLNEVEGSRVMFDRIPWDAVDEAIVVDGHSKDGTAEFFEDRGVRVVFQERRGLGEAMLTARQAITGDAIIFFHPDGNENPADISRFRPLLEDGYDFIIASRMIPGGYNEEDAKLIRIRKWANLGFAGIANVCWRRRGPYITDMMNGFRAITCTAWDRLQLDSRGCTIDYEMVIIRSFKARLNICEFPTREGDRIDGETRFRSISTGMSMLGLLRRELFNGAKVVAATPVKATLAQR
jgi:glycosyltransferase involved in cell wall biosynthesis